MKGITLLCAVALALSSSALSASAAPITYFESVGGDLRGFGTPEFDGPLTIFTLGTGLNTVSGRISFTPHDLDSFAFIVPDGLEVQSLKVIIPSMTGTMPATAWALASGSARYQGGTHIENLTLSTPGFTFAANVPLGANVYNISHIDLSAPSASTADWTFILDVHAIPEPASLALFGIAGLALLGRRCP